MLRQVFNSARSMARLPNFPGLLASTFALGTAFSFAAPFLSKWGTEAVGMTPWQFSLFMTATSICSILTNLVLGRLSDTSFSRRQMLMMGGASGALGFIAYALLREPLLLLLAGCTLNALASICFPQLFSHTREAYNSRPGQPGNSGMAISVVRVAFAFSWTMGPALGAFMLISLGFQGLFLAAALLYALFLLGIALFVPQQDRPPAAQRRPQASVWRTLGRPDLLICFVAFAAISAGNAINMLNLPLAITRTYNGVESDLGIVFGIGPVTEIPLMLWFGHLAGRGRQLPLIRLGVLLTVIYFGLLTLASEPWHIYLLQVINGAYFAILSNVAILFFQDLIPGQMGLSTALFSNSQSAGGLIGVLSFGFLVEALGHRDTYLACTGLAVLALVLIMVYRPRPQGGEAGSRL